MGLEKAILHNKEKRKPYRGSKAFDRSCRNHGDCPYCAEGRQHKQKSQKQSAKNQIEEVAENEEICDFNN